MIGPITNPAAKVAAKIAIARARCDGFTNNSLITARHDGRSVAPPKPINARDTIRTPGVEENAAHTDPMPKTAAPVRRNFFLPNLSPRLPKVMSSEPTMNP